MFLQFFKLLLLAFILITAFYVSLVLYLRSLHRERLEQHWQAQRDRGIPEPDRDAFVARGMRRYDRSAWRRTLLLIYIVPVPVIVGLVWYVNYGM